MREDINLVEAKKSIKHNIKFLESLLQHLRGSDTIFKGRAMWAAWFLHRYINDKLIEDMERAMREGKPQ